MSERSMEPLSSKKSQMSLSVLQALFVGNPYFEQIDRENTYFCPFEAVGMAEQEIRHGRFLEYCLDPRRPHGFGSEVLRVFLRTAAAALQEENDPAQPGLVTPIDVHVMDLEAAEIRREWKKIDLLAVIADEKLVIAIELKIRAKEHSGQLGRYRNIVSMHWPPEKGWRHLFLFLTLDGDDPTEDGIGWIPLDFRTLANELEVVVQKQVGNKDARAMLGAYLAMLRRRILTNDRLAELARKLWSQHEEALNFLFEHRPDGVGGIAGALFDAQEIIREKISLATNLKAVSEFSSSSYMRFGFEEWDELLPDFKSASSEGWTKSKRVLLLEIQMPSDRKKGSIHFILGPASPDIRQKFFDLLMKAGAKSTRKKLSSRYTRLSSQELLVDLDSDDPEKATEDLIMQVIGYAGDHVPKIDQAFKSDAEAIS
jgi:hypothetical protein